MTGPPNGEGLARRTSPNAQAVNPTSTEIDLTFRTEILPRLTAASMISDRMATTTDGGSERLVADIPIVAGEELGDRCATCNAPPPRRASFGWLACDHQIEAGYDRSAGTLSNPAVTP